MSQLNESKNVYRKDTATLNAEKENELAIAEKGDSIIERSGTYLSEAKKHNHLNIEEKKKQNAYIAQTVLSEVDKLIQSIEKSFENIERSFRNMDDILDEHQEGLDRLKIKAQRLTRIQHAKDSNDRDVKAETLIYLGCAESAVQDMSNEDMDSALDNAYKKELSDYNDIGDFLDHKKEEFKDEERSIEQDIKNIKENLEQAKASGNEKEVKKYQTKLESTETKLADYREKMAVQVLEAGEYFKADLNKERNEFRKDNQCDETKGFRAVIDQSIKLGVDGLNKGDIKNIFTNVSAPNLSEEEKVLEVSEKPQVRKEVAYDNGGFDFG